MVRVCSYLSMAFYSQVKGSASQHKGGNGFSYCVPLCIISSTTIIYKHTVKPTLKADCRPADNGLSYCLHAVFFWPNDCIIPHLTMKTERRGSN